MNSDIVLTEGACAYWTDPNGNMGHGCKSLLSFSTPPILVESAC